MRHFSKAALLAAATVLVSPAYAAPAQKPAPISTLVSQVSLPHTMFKLKNGLTVIVHEDHKAPVVAVSVWYNVGSKDEPEGKTGFAHLFEHLMFYGSDNVREPTMKFLEKIGATDWNGSTWFDRTNYYETVPKSELERALFMESDRMGYLLPAVDQKRLDLQRGVVQNEKRQGDNEPGGLVDYEVLATLFPEGHPYHHDAIGSMADLDAASLADVKRWFMDRYGPNNAVVALAGDITPAEARRLMEKYFGAIPRGPVNRPAQANVPTLAAPKTIVMKDQVAAIEIQRHWATPGLLAADMPALKVGTAILGGLGSSRLKQALVRDEKLAVGASANLQPFHRIGLVEINATVKPGVDPAAVEKRLNEIVADYLANGPTADEVRRAATTAAAGSIRALEKTGEEGGQAATLASGELYGGDPNFYRKTLATYAALTPAKVQAAMKKWLGRPAFTVMLEPGERPPYEEAKGAAQASAADIKVPSVKRTMPGVGKGESLDFPDISRTTLNNGVKVTYAQRTAAPLTSLVLSFDAGAAADNPASRGLQNMTMAMLDEGTITRSAQQIAEEKERLGADIGTGGSADRSVVSLSALSANLAPSLDLMTDIVEHPAFADNELERVRTQLLTGIAQAKKDPNGIAGRALPGLLYGANHPYGGPAVGNEETVKSFTRAQLEAFKNQWLRPDNAELFIVSNLPLDKLKPQLEAAFAGWKTPTIAKGVKPFSVTPPKPSGSRIVLINRPDSPQSVILAGQVTPVNPASDITAFTAASDVLGSATSSRINQDLREAKGWSYGAYSFPQMTQNAVPYLVIAPVQADRTGESVAAIVGQLKGITGTQGVTSDELAQAVATEAGALPGQFETGTAVLGAMQQLALYNRPDDYYEQLATKFRALDAAAANQAIRSAVNPDAFTYIVVGDASKVKPQLDKLGLPIEVMDAQ